MPVQSGEGAVYEAVGAGGGEVGGDGGPCGVVDLGVRRLCTNLVPRRDMTELDCL